MGLILPSGQVFDLANMAATKVVEQDLEGGLRAYRYAGQILVSIHAHLALCVKLAELRGGTLEQVAYCALHDQHEAYIGDVPRPVKDALGPAYAAIEADAEDWLHAAYGLQSPVIRGDKALFDFVRAVDHRAVALEAWAWEHPQWPRFVELHGGPLTVAEEEIALAVWRARFDLDHWSDTVKPAIRAYLGHRPISERP